MRDGMVSERMKFLASIDLKNAELIKRNQARVQEAKERMGSKYLLHPDNRIESPLRGRNR